MGAAPTCLCSRKFRADADDLSKSRKSRNRLLLSFLVNENAKLVKLGYQMFIHLIKIMNTSHIQDTSAASIYKPRQSFSRILATMRIERRKKERKSRAART